MQFIEKKKENSYEYITGGEYGEIILISPDRLIKFENGKENLEYLDDVFMAVFEQAPKGKFVEGNIEGTNINYKFTRKPMWQNEKHER